jgi:uncharacterized protein YjbJ (UPF0337 family)
MEGPGDRETRCAWKVRSKSINRVVKTCETPKETCMNDNSNKPKKSLGASGAEHTVRGKANQVGGKIQQKVGELTGNTGTQARGAARQAKGTLQAGAGKVESKAQQKVTEHKARRTLHDEQI